MNRHKKHGTTTTSTQTIRARQLGYTISIPNTTQRRLAAVTVQNAIAGRYKTTCRLEFVRKSNESQNTPLSVSDSAKDGQQVHMYVHPCTTQLMAKANLASRIAPGLSTIQPLFNPFVCGHLSTPAGIKKKDPRFPPRPHGRQHAHNPLSSSQHTNTK